MRPTWSIAALGLVLAACGTAEPDRFDLRTPGANTGQPRASAPAAPQPTPEAGKPVSPADERVIRGWSDSLRRGRVEAAARFFSVPSFISNNTPGWQKLASQDAVEAFNRGLPCGAKLLRTRPGPDAFVVGIFRLTERKGSGAGGCGPGVGATTAVAFQIREAHIRRWVVVDPSAVEPGPAPAPTATPRIS